MKKYLYNIFMLAAVAVAFVSCEKENTPVDGTFTLTVDASKEGTKGTKQLGLDGSTLNATWAAGEQVKVYNGETLLGTLTPQTTGSAHAKLSGTLEGTIAVDDVLTLKFLSPDYGSQDGTLAYIAANCDYAVATVTVSGFSGDATKTIETTGHANFVNQQAIVKFTLKDTSNADISATQLVVNDGATDYTINPASAASEIYVAIPGFRWQQTVRLTATVGSVAYTYEKSGVRFTNGQYYEITVKMTGPYPLLSTATTADYGKVVCAAGHLHDAKTAVPAGCTAVGILGKVTSTGHGLILALAYVEHHLRLVLRDHLRRHHAEGAARRCRTRRSAEELHRAGRNRRVELGRGAEERLRGDIHQPRLGCSLLERPDLRCQRE